ncbi:hypothetical protein [Acetobacter fabarum]|uniref:hypothetical protein n=1 Tax=Acetobacter fabarum TaxID=483199 RepID=UPI0020A10E33|nr:hypothetical protein [Acetobacter fabarum]MCP1227944.1 hypothetical protein [Acetobacter fabarum]MCP1233441.1 hypothetical protein [Acetobacter fabarum]
MTCDFEKKILEMHKAGKTNPEMARSLGSNVEKVRAVLKKNGLARHPAKGGQREMSRMERVGKIASLLRKGLNKEEIAKSMRLSTSSLGNWISEARAIAFPKGQRDEVEVPASRLRHLPRKDGALIPGHPIAVDAMWRGLERWRDGAQA